MSIDTTTMPLPSDRGQLYSQCIFSGKHRDIEVVLKVRRVVALWKKNVDEIVKEPREIGEELLPHKVDLLRSSQAILGTLCREMDPNRCPNHSVYVARDEAGRIHAVAMALFSSQGAHLSYLASNPNDLAIQSHRPFHGAGSGLVRHIAQDVLENQRCLQKAMDLVATDSAVPFYERLGFEPMERGWGEMFLDEDGIRRMIASKTPDHIMERCAVSSIHVQ